MRPTASFSLRRTLLSVLTAVSIACGNQAKPPAAAAPAESPASAVVAPAAGVPVVTNFGVPECDAYVSKYMACVEGKVTGEARDQLLATFEANRTKWRAMSTMREGAVALGLACRAALQKAKEELVVDYGCEF
jgi:hypothetical protein